jgi:hypothetical protein
MSLRDRCKEFYQQQRRDAMLRQGSPVDDIVAFVTTEIGRAADERFEDSVPLALFFHNVEDREEFVDVIIDAKPGMISKRWPR